MQVVTVSRVPFVISLVQSLLPGCNSSAGAMVYGILFAAGFFGIVKKDATLLLYCSRSLRAPPFPLPRHESHDCLRTVFHLYPARSSFDCKPGYGGAYFGIEGGHRSGALLAVLALLVFLQVPAIGTAVH